MTDGAEGAGQAGAGRPGDGEARDSTAGAESLGSGSSRDSSDAGDPVGGALGGERPGGREPGGAAGGEHVGGSQPADAPGAHGAYAHATPEQLLGVVRTVRRKARRARHAYWFPLVLFGLLTCASIPFYIQRFPPGGGWFSAPGRPFLGLYYFGGFGMFTSRYTAYYWLAAILVGVAATAAWYRWRGNRVGLRTPARGYLITGAVLLLLALLIPVLAQFGGGGLLLILMPGDLLVRGTFPLVIIGIGLCYLAWAERSVALSVIAAGYLALSLVASLYDIENIVYRLGWNLSPAASGLPNVVLPALVLLLSGAGAWVVQRRNRPRPARPSTAEAQTS